MEKFDIKKVDLPDLMYLVHVLKATIFAKKILPSFAGGTAVYLPSCRSSILRFSRASC